MARGRIVLTTPDSGSWTRRLLRRWWPHYKLEHLFYFNGDNLRRAMEQTGLRVTFRGPARKFVDVAYIRDHAEAYSGGLAGRAARVIGGILAGAGPRSINFGEQLVVGLRDR